MGICRFCMGKFGSEQGVKAHMKGCDLYKADKRKKSAALGNVPKAASTPSVEPSPPVAPRDPSAPLLDFVKAMHELSKKQDTPQTPQQQRRTILQAAKTQGIDHYRTPLGQVTASMRGAVKLQIERELASLPLEELSFEEVCELASAIRDRCYDPALTRQAQETERQRVEREKRHKDEVEALGALIRADHRKKIFIQQASRQAHAYCQGKGITGWGHLSLLADIESRLGIFLTGDEPIMEAQVIVQSALAARIAEAEAILAAAQAKANEKWREEMTAGLVLGAVVGLVVLSCKYPEQTLAIFEWIERMLGYTTGSEAGAPNPEAPKTAPPAASAVARPRSRRRRKNAVPPSNSEPLWGNSAGGAPGHT